MQRHWVHHLTRVVAHIIFEGAWGPDTTWQVWKLTSRDRLKLHLSLKSLVWALIAVLVFWAKLGVFDNCSLLWLLIVLLSDGCRKIDDGKVGIPATLNSIDVAPSIWWVKQLCAIPQIFLGNVALVLLSTGDFLMAKNKGRLELSFRCRWLHASQKLGLILILAPIHYNWSVYFISHPQTYSILVAWRVHIYAWIKFE